MNLGNRQDSAFLPELRKELGHPDETVGKHVVWAIGNIGGEEAAVIFRESAKTETSEVVRGELETALGEI